MALHENLCVWLDDIGIINMTASDTVIAHDKLGSTMIIAEEVAKLNEILKWLDEENITHFPFWRWRRVTEDFDSEDVWLLCPCIKFFAEESAVYFKMRYGGQTVLGKKK